MVLKYNGIFVKKFKMFKVFRKGNFKWKWEEDWWVKDFMKIRNIFNIVKVFMLLKLFCL